MKRLILMSAILLLPVMFASAQYQPTQSPAQDQSRQGERKFRQLAKQLNLTPEQELKLIPILKAEAPRVEAIKANTSLSPIQKMEQLKALHGETDPQVKAILTPDQYQTLQGIRQQEIRQAIQRKMNQ
jgi:protein CpxP